MPLGDLRRSAARMRALHGKGLRFTVFSFGVPDPGTAALLAANAGIVATWEVVLPPAEVGEAAAAIREVRQSAPVRILLAPLRTSADGLSGGTNLTHFVGHGFGLGETAAVADVFASPDIREAFAGCVLRIGWGDDPWDGIAAAARLAGALGIEAGVTVGLSPPTPEGDHRDDGMIAVRVTTAAFAALEHGTVDVFLDTFVDVDRGYYVRHGLVDRRYSLRPAGKVVRNLHRMLPAAPRPQALSRTALAFGDAYVAETADGVRCLLAKSLAGDDRRVVRIAIGGAALPEAGVGRCVDLTLGTCRDVRWQMDDTAAGRSLVVERDPELWSPSLLLIGRD